MLYCFRYYPKFLQSSTLCKFQLEYISSGELKLLDFLLGDTTLFYFMEVRFLPCVAIHVATGFGGAGCYVWCICVKANLSVSPVSWVHDSALCDVQIMWILLVCLSPDSTWSKRKPPPFSSSGWQLRAFTQTCLLPAMHLILKQPWLMQLPSMKGAKTHS